MIRQISKNTDTLVATATFLFVVHSEPETLGRCGTTKGLIRSTSAAGAGWVMGCIAADPHLSQKRDASLAKGEPQVTQNFATLVFDI
jgi:hypothetical protein